MSYLKYSFAPPIAQALYLKYGLNRLLISLFVPLIAAIVFSLIVLENPLKVLVQPFFVSGTGIAPGAGDLMTVIEKTFSNYRPTIPFKLGFYIVPLACSLIAGMEIYKRNKSSSFIAYTALNSLVFFKHLIYDYIFLLPLAAVAIKTESMRSKFIIGFGIFYYWYASRGFSQLTTGTNSFLYLNFLLNVLMLLTIVPIETPLNHRSDRAANSDLVEQRLP